MVDQRLDIALVQRGLAESRSQAQKFIKNGYVRLRQSRSVDSETEYLGRDTDNGSVLSKASMKVADDVELDVLMPEQPRFVSRAGDKLEAALSHLELTLKGQSVLDVGQSTGGFSDCVLQRGCKRLVGLDVGRDQLHSRIKNDPRVSDYEGVNARHILPEDLASHDRGPFDLVVMDVSFISQTLILPQLPAFMAPGAQLLSLVKPQFEVGKTGIGKNGIVKDASLYLAVEEKITDTLKWLGLERKAYFESAITGGDGNREFFLFASFG